MNGDKTCSNVSQVPNRSQFDAPGRRRAGDEAAQAGSLYSPHRLPTSVPAVLPENGLAAVDVVFQLIDHKILFCDMCIDQVTD
jgi:hypothetical protein